MKKWGAAVVGCGAIFPLHANAIAAMEGAELLAVADTDPARGEQAGRTYGCDYVSDYKELLRRPDIEVVHLCTPHYLHADMAVDFLRAGKHVLTEKPMATSLAAAKAMQEAAEQGGARLGVVFQNRYNETSVLMKKAVESQEYGRLVCMKAIVTWHRTEAYYKDSGWRGRWATEGGGALMNQTIHTLDLLQWFGGGEVASVRGAVTTDVLDGTIEVEDTAHACITFRNNTRALFYGTTAYLEDSPVAMELVFERGTLILRRNHLYLWRDGRETLLTGASGEKGTEAAGAGKDYWGTGHRLLIEDFYRHLQADKPFWIDGNEGVKALEIIKGIYQSPAGLSIESTL